MTDSPKTRLARRLYEAGQVCCVPWEDLNPAVQATWIIKLEAVLECGEDLRAALNSSAQPATDSTPAASPTGSRP